MDSSARLGIVIPVYDEGEIITQTLREIGRKVGTPHTVTVVFDKDDDTTLPPVRALMNESGNIRLVRNRYGRGVLNAIKTGLEDAREDAVLVSMADLSDDYAVVDTMFEKISRGFAVVCGSRYMRGGKQIGGPRFKRFLSRMAGLTLHLFSGVPTHDITNSFKMYSRQVLDGIRIESSGGFELGMEIVVKAYFGGFKITEVPTVWRDRSSGRSRFRLWRWLPKYLRWYFFALRCRMMRRKVNHA